jgi:glyoxylase-like metal-dependent hydrolase (beta-lactamase superfamily II)
MRKSIKIPLYTVLVVVVVVVGIVIAVVYYPSFKKLYFNNKTIAYDSELTIYLGGGGNSVVLNSDSAVLVVDTKFGKAAARLHQRVSTLAAGRPVIVINTHSDLDHTGGNPFYDHATIISGKVDEKYWLLNNNRKGMPAIWVTDTMNIRLGDETVSLINMGQAHSWSDVVVLFRKRGLLMSGDLIFNKINVFFGTEKGSNGRKSIEALNRMKTIPGVRIILPGHNEPGGPELIDIMLSYLEDMSMAAGHPEKEKEVTDKYSDWVKMPGVATPKLVIQYFRNHP